MNSNNFDKNLHAWDILCQKATKTRDQTSQFADIPKGTLNVWYASDVHLHTQCADEKSNKSVEDMDGTFAGW